MYAYDWKRGAFGGARLFLPNEEGLEAFKQYLATDPHQPVNMLIDLIEEEFHNDTIPFTIGTDRAALIRRLQQKHFRVNELSQVSVQGREKSGRKDLRVLASGLSNTFILNRWLDIIQEEHIPLRGIFSLPLVGESLLPILKVANKRVLLVSQQSPQAVRQSFYNEGKLLLSRLSHHGDDHESLNLSQLFADIQNTLLFLKGQRTVRRNEQVEVYIIGNRHLQKQWQAMSADAFQSVPARLHFIGQDDLGKRMGIRQTLPDEHSSGIFAQLLCASRTIKNHYGTDILRRYYKYYKTRRWLTALGVAALGVAGVALVSSYFQMELFKRYTTQAELDAQRYQQSSNSQRDHFSSLGIKPELLRGMVEASSHLRQWEASEPHVLLSEFGQLLNTHPTINILDINWFTWPQNKPIPDVMEQVKVVDLEVIEDADSLALEHRQLLRFYGEVRQTGENVRAATEAFNAFVKSIESAQHVKLLHIVKKPFDIDSTALMVGQSEKNEASLVESRAVFELLMEYQSSDD